MERERLISVDEQAVQIERLDYACVLIRTSSIEVINKGINRAQYFIRIIEETTYEEQNQCGCWQKVKTMSDEDMLQVVCVVKDASSIS